MTRKTFLIIALGSLIIVGIVLWMQALVVTEEEKIEELFHQAFRAFHQGDINTVMKFIHPNYDHEGWNYQRLGEKIAAVARQTKAASGSPDAPYEKHQIQNMSIHLTGEEAEVVLTVKTTLTPRSGIPYKLFITRVLVKLKKEKENWLVVAVEKYQR